jgi:hypothetical protein
MGGGSHDALNSSSNSSNPTPTLMWICGWLAFGPSPPSFAPLPPSSLPFHQLLQASMTFRPGSRKPFKTPSRNLQFRTVGRKRLSAANPIYIFDRGMYLFFLTATVRLSIEFLYFCLFLIYHILPITSLILITKDGHINRTCLYFYHRAPKFSSAHMSTHLIFLFLSLFSFLFFFPALVS